jgi:hypothetical protein
MRKLANADGHAAVTSYMGRDVLLWCSSNDPAINKNAVAMIDVATGNTTILHVFDWRYAFHISACAKGFAIVSLYCPDRSLPEEVWKVPMDGSPATVIGITGNIYTGYTSTPKASVTPDGTRMVGCSNFGQAADPNNSEVWIMRLDVPVPAPLPTPLRPVTFPPNKHYELHIDTDAEGVPTLTEFEN